MKKGLTIFLIFISTASFSQLRSGFIPAEARDMIAICNSFSFLKMYGDDQEIIPRNYSKEYTSEVIGMDNMFQVYVSNDRAVINFRGSTDKKTSWLENIHSAMIPASGEIFIDHNPYTYAFSYDTSAAVHGGYALAIVFMKADVIKQIKRLNSQGFYDVILTGHSQGGALSQMFRAYLEVAKGKEIDSKNTFKTYAFASPKIGNIAFTNEYNTRYCGGWSFSIINPKDMVPTFPLSYNEERLFTKESVMDILLENDSIQWKDRLLDESIRHFESSLATVFNHLGSMVSNEITKEIAEVKLPEYKRDVNYGVLAELVNIPPVFYPLELKDSTILNNDSLVSTYPIDTNGFFEDKKLYNSEPIFYQHKPYNYYVSILKLYFPKEYAELRRKCDACE